MKLKELPLNEKIELLVGSKQVFMNTASLGGKIAFGNGLSFLYLKMNLDTLM